MSKFKKKRIIQPTSRYEIDIRFEKIIQFSGWFFLFALGGFAGIWILFDILLGVIDITIGAVSFSLIIFFGTNSAISFGLATKIKNNRDKKAEFFYDWLLAEFFFCMFAIFAVAVYVW
ncbi:MAG: hypothetical protein ACFE8L_07795 [Candidatus Hodarchaeota archaeon]